MEGCEDKSVENNTSGVPIKRIQLGFADPIEEDFPLPCLPSKVGGMPVWLLPQGFPAPSDITCGRCDKPLSLLLQVNPEAFHRSLYLFSCKDGYCTRHHPHKSYRVLRAQLPADTPYYVENSDKEAKDEFIRTVDSHGCNVCGYFGRFKCAGCGKLFYCSKEHQKKDWEYHKTECPGLKDLPEGELASDKLDPRPYLTERNNPFFSEFEITIEEADKHVQANPKLGDNELPESDDDDDDDSDSIEEVIDHNKVVEENKALIEKYKQSTKRYASEEMTMADFQTNEIVKDKFLMNFQNMLKPDPDQILRYYEDNTIEPLWMHVKHMATPEKIPKCEKCGEERVCEFQVLPQLLYYLKVDDFDSPIDWSTLVVYSCKNSCSIGETYVTEFLWQQLPDNNPNEQ